MNSATPCAVACDEKDSPNEEVSAWLQRCIDLAAPDIAARKADGEFSWRGPVAFGIAYLGLDRSALFGGPCPQSGMRSLRNWLIFRVATARLLATPLGNQALDQLQLLPLDDRIPTHPTGVPPGGIWGPRDTPTGIVACNSVQ